MAARLRLGHRVHNDVFENQRQSQPRRTNRTNKETSIAYRDALSSLYLLDHVDAWSPNQKILKRAALAPKHFLADHALSARLLNLNEVKLMSATEPTTNTQGRTRLGEFLEALVALSLQRYAAANDAQMSHSRDNDGQREIDAIAHRGYAEAVGFAVKLKALISDHYGVSVIPLVLLTA